MLNFDSEQGVKLQSLAFSADAEIKSFSCRTGTRVFEEESAEGWKEDESQAQIMADAIRRVVWAYVCRSSYTDTWGSQADRTAYMLCDWDKYQSLFCKKFKILVKEREIYKTKVDADWNEQGALHGVKAGDTPDAAPKDYRMFIPR